MSSNLNIENNVTAYFNFNLTDISSSITDFSSTIITTLQEAPSSISNLFTSAQDNLKNSFNNYYNQSSLESFVDSVKGNELLNSIKDTVVDNSMVLGQTGSIVGGYVTSDAAIKLLRQDTGTSKKREFVRLAVGAGMIAASQTLSASSDLDKASLTICALSGALLNAAWKGTTNPTIHHFYVLKSKE